MPTGSVITTPWPEVDGAPRPGGRVLPREGIPQQPRIRQRDGVRVLAHLEDEETPLHEGDDPPVVVVGEDASRGQPAVRQVLQRGHERVQPRLVRGRRYPVVPGGGLLPQHLAGVGGRPGSALRR
jgi:hypothetical protein